MWVKVVSENGCYSGYNTHLFPQALAMVEDEKKRYRPTKNYLEHLPVLNLAGFEVSDS